MTIALPCDAVTFEIIRHKLLAIVDEAVIALENVSGSPITNEGHDMMVSLYRPNGDLMVGGVGYLYHLTSASAAVKHLLATYGSDPGIKEDDVYLLNDPYTAALHPPDMYVISPIHVRGQLVGFVANFVHLTDIGAMTPGGFCPDATDSFQEGFVTRGLKLVSGGRMRRDVLETVLNNVRDPGITGLDLKSQLAANHTAKVRLLRLCSDHGAELIDAVSATLIAQSEARLRDRLSLLPDGTWRARQHIDLPAEVVTVALAMTKERDTLTFDFTGSSPQTRLGINATRWGSWGGIFGALFPLLAWDQGWNDGTTRPISAILPEGSLVNCRRPAPVSIATIGVVKVVSSLAATTLSKMMATSPELARRATATWKGSHMNLAIYGTTGGGDFFVTLSTDSFAGAGGARHDADGVDLGGEISNQVGRWANAESQELNTPLRFLFRRPVPDSGGPGKYRGGVSHEMAIVPNGTRDGGLDLGLFGLGVGIPSSLGLHGGAPGCNVEYRIVRGVAPGLLPSGLDELAGASFETAQWGTARVGAEDALYVRGTGGGGYGDPLERDPARVAADVRMGLVSAAAADRIYGVSLDGGAPNSAATETRRAALRADRLGHAATRIAKPGTLGGPAVSEYLAWREDAVVCTRCEQAFLTAAGHWKNQAARRLVPPGKYGRHRESLQGIMLLELLCPACGTLLDQDLVRGDEEPLKDEVRVWPRSATPAP